MCAVKDGAVLHTLQLPLAGLISLKPAEELAVDNALMKDANRALGLVDMENPLLRIVTLALPVIPEAKMSDLGLIDVLKKEIVPLFASVSYTHLDVYKRQIKSLCPYEKV